MSTNRPDYNDEDIGRRAFQIRKERAIERTLDRVRQGLKSSWGMFTHKDVEDLGWMIGELWAFEKRADWEEMHFGKLSPEEVFEIVQTARALRENPHDTVETLERVGDIVRAHG